MPTSCKMLFARLLKRSANLVGLDIQRLAHSPSHTLLGIRGLPINTVIDVGANTGQFARFIQNIFPQAHLYCFEPLPEPFRALQEWASGRENVTLFNLAVGDTEGTLSMFHHVEHDASSSLLATTAHCEAVYPLTQKQRTVSVQGVRLDSTLNSVRRPLREILVKLDVQGYEEHVIRGGRQTLGQVKACIVEISLDRLYSGQPDFDRLVFALSQLGFRYAGNLQQAYGDDGRVVFIDAVFIR